MERPFSPAGAAAGSDDSDWIAISALEHWSYCPRQYGLIHVEATYEENAFTMRGRYAHERTHDERATSGGLDPVERGLPLYSRQCGITGKADVVEFHEGVPYPVEYKVGPHSGARHSDIQVCAQAMCLEEMMGLSVERGAVFHHASRRRREVEFDDQLRGLVLMTIEAIRSYDWRGPLPAPLADARCRSCSLLDPCLPFVVKRTWSFRRQADDLFTVQ